LQHAEAHENLMKVIFTGYETWVRMRDVETKPQSLLGKWEL
jgi:hypothetical protein